MAAMEVLDSYTEDEWKKICQKYAEQKDAFITYYNKDTFGLASYGKREMVYHFELACKIVKKEFIP